MKKSAFNALISFTILLCGALFFYLSPNWLILPISAFVWFLFEVLLRRINIKNLGAAFSMGTFLAAFDFLVENFGAYLGLWVSRNSLFFVLAVPIEIILTCLFGGAAFYLLLSSFKWNVKSVLFNSFVWSMGGMVGELYLNMIGFMRYGNGWTSFPHAFFAYLITWLILHAVFDTMSGNYFFLHAVQRIQKLNHLLENTRGKR